MKFFFNSSQNAEALKAKDFLIKEYNQHNLDEADVIVPIGGDGFLLKKLA